MYSYRSGVGVASTQILYCIFIAIIKFIHETKVFPSFILNTHPWRCTHPHFAEFVVVDRSGGGWRVGADLCVEGEKHTAAVSTTFVQAFVHLCGRVALQQLPLAACPVHTHPGRTEGWEVAWIGIKSSLWGVIIELNCYIKPTWYSTHQYKVQLVASLW